MRNLILFDVDGTICNSGQIITESMVNLINQVSENYEIGIVGGGTYEKILIQLNKQVEPLYIFSECGSVFYKLINNEYKLIYKNNLRNEKEYLLINKLIKISLEFIAKQEYLISGNFIDLRNGLIYISLVGMSATEEERNSFLILDKEYNYRLILLNILKNESVKMKINETIDIVLGGSVGIAIYPKKWNKTQVLEHIDNNYENIYYFGDKYEKNGNDYELINHERVIGKPVNNINETMEILKDL